MPENDATQSPESRPRHLVVVGPEGFLLTLQMLPPHGTRRWVARRKAEIVAAVRGGLLEIDEACASYGLSREEFCAWEAAMVEFGMRGLFGSRRRPRSPR
jgi:hypothetical protein